MCNNNAHSIRRWTEQMSGMPGGVRVHVKGRKYEIFLACKTRQDFFLLSFLRYEAPWILVNIPLLEDANICSHLSALVCATRMRWQWQRHFQSEQNFSCLFFFFFFACWELLPPLSSILNINRITNPVFIFVMIVYFAFFFFARIRACQRDVCVVSVRRWQSQFSFDDSQNRLSECCLGWWAANVCRFDPHQTKHDDENNINIQPSAERAEALAHPPFHHFNMDYEEIQFAKLWK